MPSRAWNNLEWMTLERQGVKRAGVAKLESGVLHHVRSFRQSVAHVLAWQEFCNNIYPRQLFPFWRLGKCTTLNELSKETNNRSTSYKTLYTGNCHFGIYAVVSCLFFAIGFAFYIKVSKALFFYSTLINFFSIFVHEFPVPDIRKLAQIIRQVTIRFKFESRIFIHSYTPFHLRTTVQQIWLLAECSWQQRTSPLISWHVESAICVLGVFLVYLTRNNKFYTTQMTIRFLTANFYRTCLVEWRCPIRSCVHCSHTSLWDTSTLQSSSVENSLSETPELFELPGNLLWWVW